VNTFHGQGQLGADPRLKDLEVTIAANGLDPIEEKKPKEKNSTLKGILSKLRGKKDKDLEEEDALQKMQDQLEKR
jgi:hypothetical protein